MALGTENNSVEVKLRRKYLIPPSQIRKSKRGKSIDQRKIYKINCIMKNIYRNALMYIPWVRSHTRL